MTMKARDMLRVRPAGKAVRRSKAVPRGDAISKGQQDSDPSMSEPIAPLFQTRLVVYLSRPLTRVQYIPEQRSFNACNSGCRHECLCTFYKPILVLEHAKMVAFFRPLFQIQRHPRNTSGAGSL